MEAFKTESVSEDPMMESPRSPSPEQSVVTNFNFYNNEFISSRCYSPNPGPVSDTLLFFGDEFVSEILRNLKSETITLCSSPPGPTNFSVATRVLPPQPGPSWAHDVILTPKSFDGDEESKINAIDSVECDSSRLMLADFNFKNESSVFDEVEIGEEFPSAISKEEFPLEIDVVGFENEEESALVEDVNAEPDVLPDVEEDEEEIDVVGIADDNGMVVDAVVDDFEENLYDSGYHTNSEVENDIDDPIRDPDFIPEIDDTESSDDDEERNLPYDPEVDGERESRLRRLLAYKKLFWKTLRRLHHLRRKRDIRPVEEEIADLREKRKLYFQLVPRHIRIRNQPNPAEDRPMRNRDSCDFCGKLFHIQRIRKWIRCEDCSNWLCPDCAEKPQHCQE